MDNKEIRIDFDEEDIYIMFKIINIDKKQFPYEFLYSELKEFNRNKTEIILKYLIELNILEHVNDELYLYKKKLRDLLDEQKIINKFFQYFYSFHFCHW